MAAVWQQLLGVVWLWVGLALVLAVLSGWLRSSAFKGWWGERKVRQWLRQGLNPQDYHCVHNITLRLADGSTTQIDHVVISPYGMFVLETKNFQGWIFGSEKQPTWTQSIYRHRSSFPNPLHQNWRHIKALEEVLQVPLQHLHSVVVFTGDSSFKTPMPAHVTQGRECVAYILRQQRVCWNAQQVAQWMQALSHKRLQASRATDKAHVEQLRQRHAAPAVARKVLPSNGGKLAPRVAVHEPVVPPSLAPAPLAAAPQMQPQPQPQAMETPTAPRSTCPECGDDLVQRSLSDALAKPCYFLRCARFPHCRFLQTDALEMAENH